MNKSSFLIAWLVILGCSMTGASACFAAKGENKNLWFFVLVKSNNHSQGRDGNLKLLNYHFFSELFAKEPDRIKSASLQRAGAEAEPFRYVEKGDAFYFEGGHFSTLAAVDAAHPNGEYQFYIEFTSGRIIDATLDLSGPDGSTDIPAPIRIRYSQDGREIAPDAVDPEKPLKVHWTPYTNGQEDPRGVVDDMIFVVFQNCHGQRVYHTGLPFKEENYMTYRTTETVVPVGRFEPGQVYSMFVEFPHVVDSIVVDGVPGFTSYATATYMDIVTTGESNETCPEKLPPLDTGQTDRMDADIE